VPTADTWAVPAVLGNPGDCLYHYTKLSTAIESILPTWKLKMNPFSKMRDPRESKRWGLEGHGRGSADALEDVQKFAEMNALAEELKDRVKVLALTRDDPSERSAETAIFGSGLAHPRLWEHYAESHRGVCLCFDRVMLTTRLTKKLARHGEVLHGPIKYVDGEIAPGARQILLDEVSAMTSAAALDAHVAKHVKELWFTKLRDWETEFEYRFVIQTQDADPIYVSIANSLRAVVIGEETSTQYLPALSELCDPAGVEIHRIKWQDGRPWFINPRALGYS
jgi:hypothetical protein